MEIIVDVINQKMYASIINNIAAGSQRFVKFKFNLSEDWNGLKIFAQFRQGSAAYNDFLDTDNSVYLPPEIQAGCCDLMLYGSNDITIGTVNSLTLTINDNKLISDAKSTEITESLYNQLVTEFKLLQAQVQDFTSNDDIMANITKAVNVAMLELTFSIDENQHLIVEYDDVKFDIGVAAVTIATIEQSREDDEYNIVTFSDGSKLEIKNGSKGEKGDKGDTFTYDDLTDEQKAELKEGIEQCVADQAYDPESENAQSGIAVAAAINGRMPKPILLPGAPIKTVSVMGHDDYTTITDPDNHAEVFIVNDSAFKDIIVDDGTVWGKANVSAANGCIPTRDENGNLWTGTPIDDQDCVNKKFVAEALNPYVKKVKGNGHSVQVYAVGNSDNLYDERMLIVEDNGVFEAGVEYGQIPYRQSNGNLMTNTPAKDLDCANKAYVDAAVANLEGLKVVIVSALPETGESDTLYFVPATDTQEQNLYDEYIYANDAWEKIGSAAVEVDLTDYVKNTDYASSAKYGVVCVSETYGSGVIAGGTLCGINRSYEQYKNVNGYHLISKYILENVLSERVDKPLGDIESALDELHNYAQALINGGAE